MQINRSGGTRLVVLTKNYVFKLPRMGSWKQFVQGMLSNLTEGQWKGYADKYLCPITYSNRFGLIVVMRRARPVKHTGMFWVELATVLSELDSEPDKPFDIDFLDYDSGPKNFGYYQNRLVKIDYGV